jgi:hypothetical protein
VVEHSPRHPMVKGLSPAAVASTRRKEIAKYTHHQS